MARRTIFWELYTNITHRVNTSTGTVLQFGTYNVKMFKNVVLAFISAKKFVLFLPFLLRKCWTSFKIV